MVEFILFLLVGVLFIICGIILIKLGHCEDEIINIKLRSIRESNKKQYTENTRYANGITYRQSRK